MLIDHQKTGAIGNRRVASLLIGLLNYVMYN